MRTVYTFDFHTFLLLVAGPRLVMLTQGASYKMGNCAFG